MLSEEFAKSPEIVDKLLSAFAMVNGKVEAENSRSKSLINRKPTQLIIF